MLQFFLSLIFLCSLCISILILRLFLLAFLFKQTENSSLRNVIVLFICPNRPTQSHTHTNQFKQMRFWNCYFALLQQKNEHTKFVQTKTHLFLILAIECAICNTVVVISFLVTKKRKTQQNHMCRRHHN